VIATCHTCVAIDWSAAFPASEDDASRTAETEGVSTALPVSAFCAACADTEDCTPVPEEASFTDTPAPEDVASVVDAPVAVSVSATTIEVSAVGVSAPEEVSVPATTRFAATDSVSDAVAVSLIFCVAPDVSDVVSPAVTDSVSDVPVLSVFVWADDEAADSEVLSTDEFNALAVSAPEAVSVELTPPAVVVALAASDDEPLSESATTMLALALFASLVVADSEVLSTDEFNAPDVSVEDADSDTLSTDEFNAVCASLAADVSLVATTELKAFDDVSAADAVSVSATTCELVVVCVDAADAASVSATTCELVVVCVDAADADSDTLSTDEFNALAVSAADADSEVLTPPVAATSKNALPATV
jgi:hypothetical protein